MNPAPTVVIVAWRSGRHLPACLEALLRTEGGPPPLVLVDNACPDRSTEGAESRYPGAVVVPTGANLGFAGGANAGIRKALEAGARDVVLLNPDTVPEPGWLAALAAAAEERRDAGILGSLLLDGSGERLDPWMERLLPAHLPDRTPRSFLEDRHPVEIGTVIGACMWIRRDVLREAGGFDPLFFAYAEERDLCRRTRAHGFSVLLVPGSRVRHAGEGSSRTAGARLRVKWLRCRNQGLLHLKRAGVPLRTSLLELPLRAFAASARDAGSGDLLGAALHWAVLPAQVRRWRAVRDSRREDGREWAHLGLRSGDRDVRGDRDLMSGATRLFRNLPQLQLLFDAVIPAAGPSAAPVRIAVHACSRGAEPYSLALEARRRGLLPAIRIDAFDREPSALAMARGGVLPREAVEESIGRTGLPSAGSLETASDGSFRVPAEVRASLRFALCDLRSGEELAREGRFDVVLCQNMLIHLEPEAEAEVLERLAASVAPGGWLVVAGRNPESGAVLDRLGFEPLKDRCGEIHEAWSDRRGKHDEARSRGEEPPYWALPPFDPAAPDRFLRDGTVFRRRPEARSRP